MLLACSTLGEYNIYIRIGWIHLKCLCLKTLTSAEVERLPVTDDFALPDPFLIHLIPNQLSGETYWYYVNQVSADTYTVIEELDNLRIDEQLFVLIISEKYSIALCYLYTLHNYFCIQTSTSQQPYPIFVNFGTPTKYLGL